jgi:hypothetical protein
VAVIFSHNPGGDAAPAWLVNLTVTINQIACDVVYLHQKANELPILLANSQAGAHCHHHVFSHAKYSPLALSSCSGNMLPCVAHSNSPQQ